MREEEKEKERGPFERERDQPDPLTTKSQEKDQGTLLDAAKEALIGLLENMKEGDSFGLVSFCTKAQVFISSLFFQILFVVFFFPFFEPKQTDRGRLGSLGGRKNTT